MKNHSIFPVGDQGISVSFGNRIDEEDHRKIVAMKEWILQHVFPGLKDVVIAYSSLTILYNAFEVQMHEKNVRPYEFVRSILEEAFTAKEYHSEAPVKRIPVCYEEAFAPDLRAIAEIKKMSIADIIALHCERTYRVFMIGFLPGFPYMASVDDRLITPRKARPAPSVTAGSVGIAGRQTGIYPVNSPGGWNIIGRTPTVMFNKESDTPCFLEAGDRVQFYPVSREVFQRLASSGF